MQAIFLDIETTGLDPMRHCAIDIAFKVVNISTGEWQGAYQSVIKQSPSEWEKRDLMSMQINGYSWEQVSQGKEPSLVSQEIIQQFQTLEITRGKSVFICQNPAFDRGFFTHLVDVYTQERLNWPYHWLDLASMYWAICSEKIYKEGNCFPEQMNLSKNGIANEYHLSSELEPHRAMNGVDHLILCYKAVLGAHF